MALIMREFDTMVDETLQRIIDANIGITNVTPGSVIRTIIESLLAEVDIQNYTIDQIYKAMNIDTAEGTDLDNIVAVLGVYRKQASYGEGTIVFGRSDVYASDIIIQYAQIVSTKQDANGNIYEFIVADENAKLLSGDLTTTVTIRATSPGHIYLPINTITVMNTPVIGIEYVTNNIEFSSGTDQETDDELRIRAKNALAGLGKGTISAIRSALTAESGIIDAVPMDMNRGAGTVDFVLITNEIPPSTTLVNKINDIIATTKSAGIDVGTIYPTIKPQDITITITDISGSALAEETINNAGNAIVKYCSSLSVGDILIVSQLERAIGNAINDIDVDIVTMLPNANVIPANTQVIRHGKITINGVTWDG